jgi:hypothetical protein
VLLGSLNHYARGPFTTSFLMFTQFDVAIQVVQCDNGPSSITSALVLPVTWYSSPRVLPLHLSPEW